MIQIPGYRPNKQFHRANGGPENSHFFLYEMILETQLAASDAVTAKEEIRVNRRLSVLVAPPEDSWSSFPDISGLFFSILSPLPTLCILCCTCQGGWGLKPRAALSKSFELLEFCHFPHFPTLLWMWEFILRSDIDMNYLYFTTRIGISFGKCLTVSWESEGKWSKLS